MKNRILLLFLFASFGLLFGLSACTPGGQVSPAETPTQISRLELVDGLDRAVSLEKPAQRVVSLAPSNTEILFAIGAGSQVVGRDEFSDYPAEAKDLASIGGGFGDYNYEAIVELQPDLVLAAEINTPEQVQAVEDLGLTVYYLSNPTTLEEMYANLRRVGQMTGHEAEAAALAEELAARQAAVVETSASAEARPGVFYELDNTDPGAPWTAGPGTFINTLIEMAGGHNVAADLQGQYVQISLEELLVRDPEIILLGDAAYGVTPESVPQRAGWEKIAAVQEKRIYTFDDNLVSRPGPRLVDGLEALAAEIHPELFK
jgi:iron complex transport system substrate-binding protein